MTRCLPADDPNNQWAQLCPSLAADILFTVLFALTTLVHIFQGIYWRKRYSLVIISGAALEFIALLTRILSIQNPTSMALYSVWFVVIFVSPLWINAFVYMIMGRLVYNFLPARKLGPVKASRFGVYFVALDVIAFIVQLSGAVLAVANINATPEKALQGVHIYMGGVSVQQVVIFLFIALAIRFHLEFSKQAPSTRIAKVWRMLYVIYAVLALITLRIAFRLAEYAHGLQSEIPNQEAYMYCLDSLPMLVALVLLNITHPGAIMPGKEGDIPSRKGSKLRGQHNIPTRNVELGGMR